MPNYEEIIEQSQENVQKLGIKLQELDQLHNDIRELIKQPETFELKYKQIVKLSEEYTNTLGGVTQKYLEGNNKLFISHISDLKEKLEKLEIEISRLVNTDLQKVFEDLKEEFLTQSNEALSKELNKIDDKALILKERTEDLKNEINRLENIDLEKHFDKHQKTLSEIFNAVNSININLTSITQTLSGISSAQEETRGLINKNHRDASEEINKIYQSLLEKLSNQEKATKNEFSLIKENLEQVKFENQKIKSSLKANRIIQIIGLSLIIIILLLYGFIY